MALGYFLAPLFVKMMGAGHLLAKSMYARLTIIGLFFDFCYFGYQSLLNAQGRTRTITMIGGGV